MKGHINVKELVKTPKMKKRNSLMNNSHTQHNTLQQPTELEKYVYEKVFKPQIYLYTYDGKLTANIKQLKAYDIVTEDEEIQKTDILFALSAANFTAAKSGIRIDKTIQAQNLRTAIKARERPIIANTKQLRKGNDTPVKVTMRSGHILRGNNSPSGNTTSCCGLAVKLFYSTDMQYWNIQYLTIHKKLEMSYPAFLLTPQHHLNPINTQ